MTDTFGLHRTWEGQQFLRFAYDRFISERAARSDRRGFGHGKVAQSLVGKKEEAATKEALKRWLDDGQEQIWQNDPARNARVMEALEALMMSEPAIAELMADHVSSTRRESVANALAHFFCDPGLQSDRVSFQNEALKLAGVFHVRKVWPKWWDQVQPEPSEIEHRICHFGLHRKYPFFYVQDARMQGNDILSDRRAGFAFIAKNGRMIFFMAALAHPAERYLEVLSPISHDHMLDAHFYVEMRLSTSKLRSYKVERFQNYGPVPEFTERSSTFPENSMFSTEIPDEFRFAAQRLSGNNWDIPL